MRVISILTVATTLLAGAAFAAPESHVSIHLRASGLNKCKRLKDESWANDILIVCAPKGFVGFDFDYQLSDGSFKQKCNCLSLKDGTDGRLKHVAAKPGSPGDKCISFLDLPYETLRAHFTKAAKCPAPNKETPRPTSSH